MSNSSCFSRVLVNTDTISDNHSLPPKREQARPLIYSSRVVHVCILVCSLWHVSAHWTFTTDMWSNSVLLRRVLTFNPVRGLSRRGLRVRSSHQREAFVYKCDVLVCLRGEAFGLCPDASITPVRLPPLICEGPSWCYRWIVCCHSLNVWWSSIIQCISNVCKHRI